MPYNIDPLKFAFNREYWNQPGYNPNLGSSITGKKDYFPSPTLVKLKENSWNLPPGYPDLFYCAFPEVAEWAVFGEGNKVVHEMFENKNLESITEKGEMNNESMKKIIKAFFLKENSKLECE